MTKKERETQMIREYLEQGGTITTLRTIPVQSENFITPKPSPSGFYKPDGNYPLTYRKSGAFNNSSDLQKDKKAMLAWMKGN